MKKKSPSKPIAQNFDKTPSKQFSKPPSQPPSQPFKKTKIFVKLLLLAFVLMTLAFGAFFIYYCHDLPSLDELEVQNSKQVIRINYDNENLIINHSEIYQSEVNFYELPPHLINAVIAIEDRRFFDHGGIDYIAIIRAYFVNKKSGRIVQGGSTITQQLAKLLFLKPERNMRRKIQEAILAWQLEKKFTKEKILTFYLNRAYFGSNNYGVGNASKQYFNKDVSKLNIKESALLTGLLKAPSKISPRNNPDLAKKRTKVVLYAMQQCGFLDKNFNPEEIQDEDLFREDYGHRFYFSDYVKEQLFDLVIHENEEQKILKVTTTLNEKIQNKLEESFNKFYQKNFEKLGSAQIAVVIMDKSGAILGMTGGKDYQQSQFNRAVKSKRQLGSVFKTFIYLGAFENYGDDNDKNIFKIDDIFEDKKVKVSDWLPDNYQGNFMGKINLKKAFANSSNSVAVQLSKKIGARKIAKTARLSGIISPINQNDLTIALGTNEASLLEVVASYATIANNGVPIIPYSVSKIQNQNDKILYEKVGSKFDAVFQSSSIYSIKELLREVVKSGTGKLANVDENIYGKTGTSQNFRDAWFVGFNDDLVVGVWIGNDDNSPTQKITGGSLPAELFAMIIRD